MTFTALHRALGLGPQPLTGAILDEAVKAGVPESDDLDWKSALPPAKGLALTDFPKDIAAMANSGGGLIVYGVEEDQKAATARVDVGSLSETHERALRSVAVSAITPPVFNLAIWRLEHDGDFAVVLDVPASVDGPHLIYRNELFGAPRRNDADTVWMKEREIEALYRARFEERRHSTEVLDALHAEAVAGRSTEERAWFVAVAHPRAPRLLGRMTRDEARAILSKSRSLAPIYADRNGVHPLERVETHNPQPGLRRWIAKSTASGERSAWREAWASVHHDGSVTLVAAVGGHPLSRDAHDDGGEIRASALECAVANFMAVLRCTAEELGTDEVQIRVGIAWTGEGPLKVLTQDAHGFTYDGSPLHHYTPIETTVNAREPTASFHKRVYEVAQDCLNQGGIANLRMIRPEPPDAQP